MELSFLKMSFAGAILVLVILILRLFLINKLPKKTFLILWTVAVLRLLLPFTVPSALSIYTFAERYTPKIEETQGTYTGNPEAFRRDEIAGTALSEVPDNVNLFEKNTRGGGSRFTEELSVWFFIWSVGAGIVALCFLISYVRCYRKFRTALPIPDKNMAGYVAGLLNGEYGKRLFGRKISVRQSDEISAPLTYGVFQPVILLPQKTEWQNRQQLKYVLLHEYMHICHFDALWKMVCVLVVCIHWFNPFVWLLYFFCNRDMELACDERVLHRLGEERKAGYARMLIGMEEEKSALVPVYSGFGRNAIEERVRAIMKIKKISLGCVLFCTALIVIVVIGFATSSKRKETAALPEAVVEDPGAEETEDTQILEPEAEEIKEKEYTLTFMTEGMEEVVPAECYVGNGYSILIPKEDWILQAPGCWTSAYNMDVSLEIVKYENKNLLEVGSELEALEFLSEGSVYQKTYPGVSVNYQLLYEDGSSVWGVCYSYPDNPEMTEGFGSRLPVIAASFQAVPKDGSFQTVPEDASLQEGTETLDFSELSNLQFTFYSGAGGWGTLLQIDSEGAFFGEFFDSDMGETGEGHPYGIKYQCCFSGRFTEPRKVNASTYSMQIAEIYYENEPGTEEIRDGILYRYTEPYGLEGADEILLYMPGSSLLELPESYRDWVGYSEPMMEMNKETELPFWGLYNVETESGFASHDIVKEAEE